MDYRGLGSVIGRKQQRSNMQREEMMRKAAKAKRGQNIGGMIGGGLSALGAGLATKGNPAAVMGAYQAGNEATRALLGDKNADIGSAALTAAGTATGYFDDKAAAKSAKQQNELLAAALKKLTA